MPITIGTNTYATLSEAEAYLYESFRGPDWNVWALPTAPTDPSILTSQEIALVTAARLIDRQPLRGSKLDSAQALAFPRDYTDGVPLEIKHAQIETTISLLDYLKRRAMPAPTLDLANFMDGGFAGSQGTSGVKLAVSQVTLEEDGESNTRKVTLAPAQAVTIPQLPTELPAAALLLLKDHLAVGIVLNR